MSNRPTFLPFSPVPVGEGEVERVVEAIRSGWITTGPRVGEFEKRFGAYVDAPATLALSSCTAALHTALVVLGIGPGDEVITTPLTFTASVAVIEHTGATPVLVDVEEDTLNIDPKAVEAAIHENTKAILPVHYGGHPVDLDAIDAIAEQHGLQVVEDAAHAFPAKYKGRWIGSRPNPTAFSFYATKNLTTGEGGALIAEPEVIDIARQVSLHGMSRDAWKRYDQKGSWYYEIVREGFKYNMTDIQAAMGIAQLGKIDSFTKRRHEIVAGYNTAFDGCDAFQLPMERPDVESAWHLYPVRLNLDALTIDRDRFIDEMKARNIGTSVHFIPIHLHPYWADRYGYAPTDFSVTSAAYPRLVSLPLTPALSDADVDDVIEAALDVVATFKR